MQLWGRLLATWIVKEFDLSFSQGLICLTGLLLPISSTNLLKIICHFQWTQFLSDDNACRLTKRNLNPLTIWRTIIIAIIVPVSSLAFLNLVGIATDGEHSICVLTQNLWLPIMIGIFSEPLKRLTQYNNFGFVSYISLNKINIPHRNTLNTTTQQSAVISTYYQTLAIKQIWTGPFYKACLSEIAWFSCKSTYIFF